MPTVLVVDDSATDRRLAGGLLERNSHLHVLYSNDGSEALSELERHIPDIVVTDLVMPKVDGLKLVSVVKNEYPLIPVILMTAQGSEEIAVRALELGASGYVTKKAMARELVPTVMRVLETASEERSLTRLMHRVAETQTDFVLENDPSLLRSLVGYLQQMIRCMRLSDETERLRVAIALEAALDNAMYHGNLEISPELRSADRRAYFELAKQRCLQSPYCDRRIHVHAHITRTSAVYVIRDEGAGFKPPDLQTPTAPSDLHQNRGKGLILMRTFMDEIAYNDSGNEVTLIKKPRSENASEGVGVEVTLD